MGGKGIQALTTFDDFELWEIVEEMGGPPEPYSDVKDFWLGVLRRWNHDHPRGAPLRSWEGLQMKYRRVYG